MHSITHSFSMTTFSFLPSVSWMTACVFVTISMQLEHLNMKSPLVYDLSVALYCVVCVGAGECV